MLHTNGRGRTIILAALLPALAVTGTVFAAAMHDVTQRGRMFHPDAMTISRGDTIRMMNDDGDLLHHAFIKAKDFSYDSGDQEPGSTSDVVFTKSGTFTILCGIHPKMKMTVIVKE